MTKEETITKEEVKQGLQHIKKRIKDPKFWIDNFLLILLGILIIGGQIDGMYIRNEVHIIETCEGQPTNLTQITILEQKGLITKWNPNNKTINNSQISPLKKG